MTKDERRRTNDSSSIFRLLNFHRQKRLAGLDPLVWAEVYYRYGYSMVIRGRSQRRARVDGFDWALRDIYVALPMSQGQIIATSLRHLIRIDG